MNAPTGRTTKVNGIHVVLSDAQRIELAKMMKPVGLGDGCSSSEQRGYLCTRETGHKGAHVGHGEDGFPVAVWTEEFEMK
jgi:hypothetical protein